MVSAAISVTSPAAITIANTKAIDSSELSRKVTITQYQYLESLAARYAKPIIILINDGQLLAEMNFQTAFNEACMVAKVRSAVTIGIHADNNLRLQEYGVAGIPDYLGRGSGANRYNQFILENLLPKVETEYGRPVERYAVGMSLGGLSAFDIAWNYPNVFSGAAPMSASFWWRSKAVDPKAPPHERDQNRIMVDLIENSPPRYLDTRFFFYVGDKEEQCDRNENGIIDAVDDTVAIMDALRGGNHINYENQIKYIPRVGGEHSPRDWQMVLPELFAWIFKSC